MKFFAFAGFFLCSLFTLAQQPNLQQITEKFYSTYDVSGLPYPRVIIHKKNKRWYVAAAQLTNSQLEPITEPELLFDGKSFKKLKSIPQKDIADSVSYSDFVQDFEIYYYNLHPFYGYSGWYKDVVSLYTRQSSLTDQQRYSLAKAYSSWAQCRLTNAAGDCLDAETFACSFKKNCLTKQQIDTFNLLHQQGLRQLEQLVKKNPDYPTYVGPATIKLANEYVVQMHLLMSVAENYANNIVLPGKIYADSILVKYRKVLTDCPQQSIFLSFGDNDFYPVLYLQQKEKLRRDVYLINFSLIGLDRYIYGITQPQFDAAGIKLSLDTSNYKGSENDYLLVQSDSASSLSLAETISTAKTGELHPEYSRRQLPHNVFKIDVGNAHGVVKFPGYVLFKNQLIVLDMMHNLNGRKLCMESTFYDEFSELNKLFKQSGAVMVLQN